VLLSVDIAPLGMIDPIPTGVLDGKRNVLIHVRPEDVAESGSWPSKVTHILAEATGYDLQTAFKHMSMCLPGVDAYSILII
jgi:hypothetical protein